MRVAVIAPPWLPVPPPAYGGTELVLDGLCRALAAAGHDVLLFASGDSTCPVERAWAFAVAPGTDHIHPESELLHVLAAYEKVVEWGADVVHDHTLVGPLYASTHHPTLPVVTTNHGPFKGELELVYARVAGTVPIIAISEHHASTAGAIPVETVIHHGIDLDGYSVGRGTGGYALFLGRMNPDKGIDTAIKVARHAGVPLRIAAKMREPEEFEYYRAVVEPLLGDEVDNVGEVGGDDKLALLGEAVCLLNPITWAEPFGMVMIEALATGTPVVATPHGAAPEIVDDGVTGFLRRDVESLSAALAASATLDRAACRRAAEARFSMARMAADHLAFYERIVDEARRRDRSGACPAF
jgi:glycosyltransferase involved in cell wall biosynthesis